MKKFNIYLAIIGILPLLISCSDRDTISDTEKILITKEIEEILNGYPEAFKRQDLDWYQNFWFKDKDFVMAGDGKIEANYDSAITKRYREAFSNFKGVLYFKWSNGHSHVINKNAVSYTTNFDWRFLTVSGDTIKSNGSWLYVFRKSEGKWRVIQSAGTHNYYK